MPKLRPFVVIVTFIYWATNPEAKLGDIKWVVIINQLDMYIL